MSEGIEIIERNEAHAARLSLMTGKGSKIRKIRYACEALGNPSTSDVLAFLLRHGEVKDPRKERSYVSDVVNKWRTERGLSDTSGSLLPMSDELMDAIEDQRAADVGTLSPVPVVRDHRGHETANADAPPQVSAMVANTDTDTSPVVNSAPIVADANADTSAPDVREHPRPVADMITDTAPGQGVSGHRGQADTDRGHLAVIADTDRGHPAPIADTPARPVRDAVRRPDTVKVMVRFGWQRWAGAVAVLLGVSVMSAAGAFEFARRVFGWAPSFTADWQIIAAGGLAGLLCAVVGLTLISRAPRREVRRTLLTVPAKAWYAMFGLALVASSDASFHMWREVVKLSVIESTLVFLLLEGMIVAASLSMRANLISEGTPGVARTVLWSLSAFAVVAAFATTDSVGAGLWRSVFGPISATVCLHMAMGVEMRAEGTKESISRVSEALRSLGQHVLSFVGAGSGDQTWIVIRHQRAVARAARLGSVAAPGRFTVWRLRRARRACGAGVTEAGTVDLMAALAAERATHALFALSTVSPWDGRTVIEAPAVEAARRKREPKKK